jgi:hypothetical protein
LKAATSVPLELLPPPPLVVAPGQAPVKARSPLDRLATAKKRVGARKRRGAVAIRIPVPPAHAPWVMRLFVEPNVDGPRSRVGLLWFLVVVPAAYLGVTTTAFVFAVLSGFAAWQSARAWHELGYRPSREVAVVAAVLMPAAALINYSYPGALLAVLPLAALIAALVVAPGDRASVSATAGMTVRCALPGAVAAAGMVYTARISVAAAIVVIVLVSAYDAGSFLVGAEASSPAHGVIAGAICVMVAIAPVWAFQLPPFDELPSAAWIFGGMVAVLAPFGQMAASAALPTAPTWVPALRRLDAYIVVGVFWAWALWGFLA